MLEIHTELPGRIHVVLIRQQVGYEPAGHPDMGAMGSSAMP